jgi:CRISPR system Cascade subunit CasD
MILAFDVWAVFGTWGTAALSASNLARRETQLHPGKAAITGIVGAALGEPRDLLPDLAQQVLVACRTDAMPNRMPRPDYEATRRTLVSQTRPGERRTTRFEEMRDFARANGGPGGSIQSWREYWTAGGWTVFIAASGDLLRRLNDAIRSPVYPIFAGRRSCHLAFRPAPVLLPVDGLDEAVRRYPGLHARLSEPVLLAAISAWRTNKDGPLHWEDGFPAPPPAMARRSVRQFPLPIRRGDNQPHHLLRRFGEYTECSAPGPPVQ